MDYYQSSIFAVVRRRACGIGMGFILATVWLSPKVFAFEKIKLASELALSLPQPLTIGVEGYCFGSEDYCQGNWRYFGAVGIFKWPITASDRSLTETSIEGGVRAFLFGFPMYVSASLGYRYLVIKTGMSQYVIGNEALADSASIQLSTLYFSPGVGWKFTLSENLFLSVDLGLQIPLWAYGTLYLENNSTGQNSSNSEVLKTDSDLALRRLAAFILPKLTMARLTYYF